MGDTKRVQRDKPKEHGTGINGPRYSLARLRYEIGKAREAERLRFEGDLDRWMKLIGAGITGYQPEAYTMIDTALADLVRLRSAVPKLGVTLDGTPIHPGNFPKPSGRLVTGGTPPSPVLRDDNAVRDAALEEAANAAESAKIPGSLLRPGIAKVIRALKSKGAV